MTKRRGWLSPPPSKFSGSSQAGSSLPGTVEPRRGLEVPGRHRDFGGQEEGQSRRLPQQKRHQGQGCCRRREGSCCTDQTNHRTDCSIWCRLISSSFFLEKYITLCEKKKK